ncbi:TetR/AcrR family transcriptional regulator [Pseudoclavibacter albus]|uniref:TetR/AcrR family transcriptional regulator n=1 Tax=Pseudoclavibacter albus TaxID=272241 RepID=UPI0013520E24
MGIIMRRHILKLEPLASMSRDDLVATVGPTIQRDLTGELPLTFDTQAEQHALARLTCSAATLRSGGPHEDRTCARLRWRSRLCAHRRH